MVQKPTQLEKDDRSWRSWLLRLALGVYPSFYTSKEHEELYRLTPAMVELLLSRGSNPNARNSVGQTIVTWQEFLMNVNQGKLPD
jgi:hypothetical protein